MVPEEDSNGFCNVMKKLLISERRTLKAPKKAPIEGVLPAF